MHLYIDANTDLTRVIQKFLSHTQKEDSYLNIFAVATHEHVL